MLNGFIQISSEGLPSGSVVATYGKDGIAVIKAYPSLGLNVEIPKYGEDRDFILLMGTERMIAIGDTRITHTDVHESFITNLTSERNLANWDESSQATLAILAVTQSDIWVENTTVVREMEAEGTVLASKFWCEATAYGAQRPLLWSQRPAALHCWHHVLQQQLSRLVVWRFPCTLLEGLCIGGVFTGFTAAHALTLAVWHP